MQTCQKIKLSAENCAATLATLHNSDTNFYSSLSLTIFFNICFQHFFFFSMYIFFTFSIYTVMYMSTVLLQHAKARRGLEGSQLLHHWRLCCCSLCIIHLSELIPRGSSTCPRLVQLDERQAEYLTYSVPQTFQRKKHRSAREKMLENSSASSKTKTTFLIRILLFILSYRTGCEAKLSLSVTDRAVRYQRGEKGGSYQRRTEERGGGGT